MKCLFLDSYTSGTPQLFVLNIVALIEPSNLKTWAHKNKKKNGKIADISFQNVNVANQILDTDTLYARIYTHNVDEMVYRTVLILYL